MRYSAHDYARAIIDLSETLNGEDKQSLPKRLAKSLEKNGSLSLYPQIVDAVQEIRVTRSGKKKIIVKFAGNIDKTKIKEDLGNSAEVEFIESPEIKGGVQIFIDDIRIDNSIKGRLDALKKVLT